MKRLLLNFNEAKRATVLIFCLMAFSTGITAQNQAKDVARLDVESEIIDYGQIGQNDDGERVFSFTNTGKAPLIISNVKTSCGCTVPTYPKTAILPGDTGEIAVSYDTKRIGVFSKTITVFSNADEPTKTLKIKGEVLKNSL